MLKSWKYGLIKIEHPSIEEDNFCELVELYACDSQDQYISYNSVMLLMIWSIEESDSLGYIGKEIIDSYNEFAIGKLSILNWYLFL